MFYYNIYRIYMSYHILFEGVCFVLSYSTQIWNAYVAGNLLEIKIAKEPRSPLNICLVTPHLVVLGIRPLSLLAFFRLLSLFFLRSHFSLLPMRYDWKSWSASIVAILTIQLFWKTAALCDLYQRGT